MIKNLQRKFERTKSVPYSSIVIVTLFFTACGTTVAPKEQAAVGLSIENRSQHWRYIASQSSCFGDSAAISKLTMYLIKVKNNSYDTIFINYNSQLCDSVAILSPEVIAYYQQVDGKTILHSSSILCHFGASPVVKINKADSALLLLSSCPYYPGTNMLQSSYPFDMDSAGTKIYAKMKLRDLSGYPPEVFMERERQAEY